MDLHFADPPTDFRFFGSVFRETEHDSGTDGTLELIATSGKEGQYLLQTDHSHPREIHEGGFHSWKGEATSLSSAFRSNLTSFTSAATRTVAVQTVYRNLFLP